MPNSHLPRTVIGLIVAMLGAQTVLAQPPGKDPTAKPLPDETRILIKEVEEAYKAPLEVDADVRDELRKAYQKPSPEREAKIFAEVRRLYVTTPEQEQAILGEIRRAYERPSPEQEARIFDMIRSGGKHPLGTVPAGLQAEQSSKMFRRYDQNNDGKLAGEELPESLREQAPKWDRNRDGGIDADEYRNYYQTRLQVVSDKVASGEIPIKLPKGETVQGLIDKEGGPRPGGGAKPAKAAPPLPAWFAEYDTDKDGQVGLYEWRRKDKWIADFAAMDRNGDGYLTPAELTHYLVEQAQNAPAMPARPGPGKYP